MLDLTRATMLALIAVWPTVAPAQTTTANPAPPPVDWSAVDRALGRTGTASPENVMRYGFPRTDLAVTVAGVTIRPAFALGGWIAFRMVGAKQAMAMGDLVLTEDEIAPVMRALQDGGIDQTAIHHHLLGESPRVFYMHVGAHGDPATIAAAVHSALERSRTPLGPPAAAPPPAAIDLDTAAIARLIGVGGSVNGGVLQFNVPRAETIRQQGHELTPAMGVGTVINFQPTGGGAAAITGDFVLLAAEVNPVIRTLLANGISATAIHSHMLDESPRLTMMHFWANADAVTLARGLGAALDKTASKRAPAR